MAAQFPMMHGVVNQYPMVYMPQQFQPVQHCALVARPVPVAAPVMQVASQVCGVPQVPVCTVPMAVPVTGQEPLVSPLPKPHTLAPATGIAVLPMAVASSNTSDQQRHKGGICTPSVTGDSDTAGSGSESSEESKLTAAQTDETRYTGTVKSYDPRRGFGFIQCDETDAKYQRDVFLHKIQLGEMCLGQGCHFMVEVNRRGFPQARNVMPIGQPLGPPAVSGPRRRRLEGRSRSTQSSAGLTNSSAAPDSDDDADFALPELLEDDDCDLQ